MGQVTNCVAVCVIGLLPHQPRRIIDPVDISQNTNIVRLFAMLKKDDPESQVCYYQESTRPSTVSYALNPTERLTQAGVGTYIKPGAASPFLRSYIKFFDRALALYINEHVLDGYRFLMQHYQKDDRICLFGCVLVFFWDVISFNLTFPGRILPWRVHSTCTCRDATQSEAFPIKL
jgi:hypothetical protein